MSEMILFVGIPASGKSTFAELNKSEAVIVSSDEIRATLFGGVENQDKNDAVFTIVKTATISNLKSGKHVFVDATNIARKRRIQFLKDIKRAVGEDHLFNAIFFPTPIEMAIKRNEERDRHVPTHVIERMYKQLSPPTTDEGFDEVYIELFHSGVKAIKFPLYTLTREKVIRERFFDILNKIIPEACGVEHINHDSPYHSETIGEHIYRTYENMFDYVGEYQNELIAASIFHDIGKVYAKEFHPDRGHFMFIGHENISTNIATRYSFDVKPFNYDFFLKVIKYHMVGHQKAESIIKVAFSQDDQREAFEAFLKADDTAKN